MFKYLLSNNDDFYDFINSNLSLENSVSLVENPKPFYKQENDILNLILILLFIALIIYLIHLFTKK